MNAELLDAEETNEERLKRDVAAAVDASWSQFEVDHPALAREIDRTLLAEHVADTLADDPAFVNAYRAALEAQAGARVLGDLVQRFVAIAVTKLR